MSIPVQFVFSSNKGIHREGAKNANETIMLQKNSEISRNQKLAGDVQPAAHVIHVADRLQGKN